MLNTRLNKMSWKLPRRSSFAGRICTHGQSNSKSAICASPSRHYLQQGARYERPDARASVMDGRQCQRVAKFAELEYALIGQRQCDIESKPEKEPHWPWNAHHIGNAHIGKGKQPSVKNQVKNFLAWEQILGHDCQWSTRVEG